MSHSLALSRAGRAPKKKSAVIKKAQIDTGATITCIRDAIAQELSLKKVRSVKIYTGEGTVKCPIYSAELGFGPFKFFMSVVGIPARHQKLDFLIGRDLLEKFSFLYSGPAQEFFLCRGDIKLNVTVPDKK